jgi:hypothetical protein
MKNKTIYIDGYWIDTKETFSNYKCIIGDWNGNEEDDDIFYYFENDEDVNCYKETKDRTDTEFVITKVRG